MASHFDFLAIGGGSAGFNAARTAAAEFPGKRVALIDGARELGGLCILRGCMPSKTLLYSAEVLHLAQRGAEFGLSIDDARVDMKSLHARKLKIIGEFAAYRQKAMQSGKFTLLRANAKFLDPRTVQLSTGETITADRIVIGVGSRPSWPAVPGLAESKPWTSDDVLELDYLPESVIVLGGGVVGCELAQFLRRIGSKVVMIQRSCTLLKDFSPDATAVIGKAFADEGIEYYGDTTLVRVRKSDGWFEVEFRQGNKLVVRKARQLLNALGREPDLAALELGAAGVKLLPSGRIATNAWQQTSQPHIYAGGDCAGPHEIVHTAVAQGELAARHAFGKPGLKPVDYSGLVHVVFTDPQLAIAGRTEKFLREEKIPHVAASYPFDDHGKSILMGATYGYVKVIASPADGRILGAEIVGKDAGEMIHVFSVAIALRGTVHDLLHRAQWYHPTLTEIITYPLEDLVAKCGRG